MLKNKNTVINIIALCGVFFLIAFPKEMVFAAKTGLLSWFNNVVPSLFPFMVIVNIIISSKGRLSVPSFIYVPFKKFFLVPEAGITAYLFGTLSGYPLGAKIAADLYRSNAISKDDIQRLLLFCCNAGPMFIMGALSCGILNDVKAGYIILISSIISNALTGALFGRILFNFLRPFQNSIITCSQYKTSASPVQSSCEAIIRVGGYIILFSIISAIMEICGITKTAAELLSLFIPVEYADIKAILSGMLEMTCGINALSNSPSSIIIKSVVSAFIVSFGGLSVIMQSADFLRGTGIDFRLFIIGKLINGIITAAITFAVMLFIG